MGVQEVRWDKGGTVRAGDYNFFYGKGKSSFGNRIFCTVHQRIASTIKRVEFVSNRVSYIVLRGRWCNIIVLNMHPPSEEKKPLGRPIRRWEDIIKMDLREMGGGGDWMELAQDIDRLRALVKTVMILRVP